jgi:hypothetical protein
VWKHEKEEEEKNEKQEDILGNTLTAVSGLKVWHFGLLY